MSDLNQKNGQNNKVKVTVKKHLWPDEIAKHKEAKRSKIITIFIFSFVFLVFGFFVGKSFYFDNTTSIGNSKYNQIEEIMTNRWYFGKDIPNLKEIVNDNALRGLSNFPEHDIHTYYLSKEDMEQFTSNLSGSYVGIGILYYESESGNFIVKRVFENSPAKLSGIRAGDILTKVDGKSLTGFTTEEVRSLVLGEEGSELILTVLRDGKEINFNLKRAKVYHSVYGEIIKGAGYIELDQFGESTAKEVLNYLNKFSESQNKIILDLRDNGGGYLDSVVDIASYLIAKDQVVLITENNTGKQIKEYTNYDNHYEFEKIVVLVNENTASASEVLIAALSYHLDNVTVVGVNSYGKGTVQQSKTFNDGSAMKYTTAEWLTPDGDKINKVGIKPDVEVELHPILTEPFALFDENLIYRYDSVGFPVATAQKALDFLGYKIQRTDGYFDSLTEGAIKNYQKDLNLAANGILDKTLYDMILSKTIREWTENSPKYDKQLAEALVIINE